MSTGAVSPSPQVAPRVSGSKVIEYGDYIERELKKTSRQVKGVDFTSVLMALAAGALGYLLVVILADHWLIEGGLGFAGRLLAFFVFLAGIVVFFAASLAPLIFRRINPVYAAHAIEESRPTLKNSLVNFLLLRSDPRGVQQGVFDAVRKQAATRLSEVTIDAAVDRSRLIKIAYALLGVVVACVLYQWFSPKDPLTSVGRVIAPWADLPAPTRVRLENITPGDARVPQNTEFITISATARGVRSSDRMTIVYSTADARTVDKRVPMLAGQDEREFSAQIPPSGGLSQDLEYHVECGDAVSPRFKVTVVTQPVMSVEEIVYEYPAYTGRETETIPKRGDIEALEGTRVTVRGAANDDIATAHIDFDHDGRRDQAMRIEGRKADTTFTLGFRRDTPDLPEHDSYQLRFTNPDGHENPTPILHSIKVIRDLPPVVRLVDPTLKESEETPAAANDAIPLVFEAHDPDFELNTIRLVAEREGKRLIEESLLPAPVAGEFRRSVLLILDGHDLKPGDKVEFWAEAADNKTPLPNVAKTPKYVVRIVDRRENPEAAKDPKNDGRQGENGQDQGHPKENPGRQGQNNENKNNENKNQDPNQQQDPDSQDADPKEDQGQNENANQKPGDKSNKGADRKENSSKNGGNKDQTNKDRASEGQDPQNGDQNADSQDSAHGAQGDQGANAKDQGQDKQGKGQKNSAKGTSQSSENSGEQGAEKEADRSASKAPADRNPSKENSRSNPMGGNESSDENTNSDSPDENSGAEQAEQPGSSNDQRNPSNAKKRGPLGDEKPEKENATNGGDSSDSRNPQKDNPDKSQQPDSAAHSPKDRTQRGDKSNSGQNGDKNSGGSKENHAESNRRVDPNSEPGEAFERINQHAEQKEAQERREKGETEPSRAGTQGEKNETNQPQPKDGSNGAGDKSDGVKDSAKKQPGDRQGEPNPKNTAGDQPSSEESATKQPAAGDEKDPTKTGEQEKPGQNSGKEPEAGQDGAGKENAGNQGAGEKSPGKEGDDRKEGAENSTEEGNAAQGSNAKGGVKKDAASKNQDANAAGNEKGDVEEQGKEGADSRPMPDDKNSAKGAGQGDKQDQPGKRGVGEGAKEKQPRDGIRDPKDDSGAESKQDGNAGQSAGSGKEKETPESNDKPDKEGKGDSQPTDKGEAGAEKAEAGGAGSAAPTETNRPTPKGDSSSGAKRSDSEDRAESPSSSERQSDNASGEDGDRSGQGKRGGGNRSPSPGVGSAGQNTAADAGGGKAEQAGEGETSREGGDKIKSDQLTDGAQERTEGEGAKRRPGDREPGSAGTEDSTPASDRQNQANPNPNAKNDTDSENQPSGENQPGEGDGGGKPRPPGEAPPPRNGAANEQPTGFGQAGNNDPATRKKEKGPEPGGDEANLEYARKAADLALQRLKDELKKEEPDQELLDKLKWTREDMEQFVDKWEKMKREAKEPGKKGEESRDILDEALRSLGLRPKGAAFEDKGAADEKSKGMRSSRRTSIPSEYKDQYRGYSTSTSKGRPKK